MCSANCILPFPGTSAEVSLCHPSLPELAADSIYALPMAPCPTQYEGAPPHFLPQHGSCAELGHPGEVELTWQELMSLAELQGLDANGDMANDPNTFYAGGAQHLPPPDPYTLPAAWSGHSAGYRPLLPPPAAYDSRPLAFEPTVDPCCHSSLASFLSEPLLLGLGAKRREDGESDSGLSLDDSSPDGWGPMPDFHGQWCYGNAELPATATQHPHPPAEGPSGARPAPCPRAKRDHGGCRDQRRAHALGIPFSADTIVNLPVDDFNELASHHRLSEPQLALARDIRRRGKNKVAAQNCRQRKLEKIALLERELGGLRSERSRLAAERDGMDRALCQARHRMAELRQRVFAGLRDPRGRPYSPQEFALQQTADGGVFLVPRGSMAAPSEGGD
uniref:transcription factor NF-E2 45 kDa subunit-like n=1 Tax=Pristiophorus japonicus TaxID=55135 RepID=UPI00398F2959